MGLYVAIYGDIWGYIGVLLLSKDSHLLAAAQLVQQLRDDIFKETGGDARDSRIPRWFRV